ncbi:uncharacterized protein [Oryza sativa Japonica Group]|jgi:hypothetical protein|uniref:DUF4408 domain-containing protein n=3 Tax=Oryza TaxID=4527 RepID=A0A0E0QIQ6_ORYRU|nr:uncharacterized protein LOC4345515 [Oryza sativa Japonica Group]XP_052165883.1 uncharacterized protein LOC127782654 [Oryza glaberrima]EAZ06923.1 hypothetical protein OsI_29162 [Oryza sativa Indica Group]KAF2919586.1 hypothetical protein DAI22_08g145900 [Oryza sativa Japonica Group]
MAVVQMLSWLSSGAAWFVFLNVIVGAIAVVSWLGQGVGGTTSTPSSAARRRLARTASTVVMERLRSVANFPFQYLSGDYSATPLHVHGDVSSGSDYFYYPREAEEELVEAVAAAPFRPEPPAPVREVVAATTPSMAAPRSSPVAAATAAAIKNEEEEAEAEEEEESISLDEAYALAQQAQARSPRSAPDAAAAAKAADAKPRRARAEEVEEGKAEVNARAERFIKQFREDLKLQRINSIINYTNALRRRGAGGVAATAPAPAR